ncbi:MAG: AsmA-like C-terminal domain-containing protein [Thermodesulfobacteriota bacterium]|nr:AsmA-like C-terminal domain-containing protein [Thermodesulfobacteriota bacterium]
MKKLFKTALFCILLTVIALAAAIPAVNFALKSEEVRNVLLQKVASSLDGTLQADGLTIALDEKSLNISSRELKGSLLNNTLKVTLPNSTFRITFRELLKGSFFPDTFQAESPYISYNPQPSAASSPVQNLNWSREINSLLKKILGYGGRIHITDGTLVFASTTFSKLFIQTNPDIPSTVLDFRTDILYRGSVIPVKITGKCRNPLTSCFTYDFDVQVSSIPLHMVPASDYFFFSKGSADFSGKLSRSGKDITLKGNLKVTDLDMTVAWNSEDGTRRQEKPYRIPHCSLELHGGLQGRKINFPSLDLRADNFHLLGSFILNFDTITNPFMDLRLSSDEMELATLKMLLPDPLINDWTTRTIFPRIENGTARITDFVLAGTMDEIGRLSEPENSHSLSWAGILHNVDTFYNDHKPLARVHTAHLSMNGDLFEIRELSGESGKSTLTGGNLSISNLYDSTSTVTTDIQGSFSLAWLSKLVKAGLTGEKMQQLLSQVSSLSGQVNGNVNLSLALSKEDVTLKTLGGKGTAASMEIKFNNFIFPLKMKTAGFILAYPDNSVITGKGSLGKSTFSGNLNMAGIDWKREFKLNIKADLNELKKRLTDNKTMKVLAPCVATLPLKANIILEKDTVTSSGSLDFAKSVFDNSTLCKKTVVHSQLIKAEYNAKYRKRTLDITKLSLHTRDGTLQASGVYNTRNNPPAVFKKFKIKATNFPVQALSVLIPEQQKWLSGILNAELKATELSLDSLWPSLGGSLNLKGWQGSFSHPSITVNNMNLSGTLAQGLIELNGSDVRLDKFNSEYPLTFHADLQYTNLWNGTVRLYGDYLDLTTSPSLFREGNTNLSDRLPIEKIRIIAEAGHMRYRNLIFSPLLVQSHFTADKVIISKGLLQLDNDFIWLTGSRKNDDVLYQTYFTIKGKPVDTMLAMMGFESKTITGSLDMKGKLTATVSSSDETVFETASGPIYVEVKDGTIKSSSTFIKILELISLENIFSKTDILQWKDNYKFDLIQGKFDLNQGMFTTDSLLMDASAFNIFSEGTIDIINDTINMKVKLAPFDTLNKLFSSIPYLGYVLTGKSKSLFDYILSVTGKIGSPDVQYTPLAGTIESLTGYVQRLVSGREEVNKEVNNQLKVDIARKNSFILRMEQELAPLR